MADKIYAIDPVSGLCELKNLTPYPVVESTDTSIDVDVTTDTVTGQKTYSVKVNKIGVDRNGADVVAGDCLVTCATDIFAQSIDDTGTSTTITLNNGTSITSPETDENKYVTGFTIVGDVATISMSDGTNHVSNITHPAFPADVRVNGFDITGDTVTVTLSNGDSYTDTITHPSSDVNVNLTDAVIDPVAETITYSFSDGSSFVKPHPASSSATMNTLVKDCSGNNNTLTSTVNGVSSTESLSWLVERVRNDKDSPAGWNPKFFKNTTSNTDIVSDTVLKTETISKSDIPGIRDCDNAIKVRATCGVYVNPLDSIPATSTLASATSYLDVEGLNYVENLAQVKTAENTIFSGGEPRTLVIPFKADGTITFTHRSDSMPSTTHTEKHDTYANVRLISTLRVEPA